MESALSNGSLDVLVFGGDGRRLRARWAQACVTHIPSSRYGGNGSARRAVVRIHQGRPALVVLLVRWMGHPERDVIVRACRLAGIPVIAVPGGSASAVGLIAMHLAASTTAGAS